ncbi:hypothetical protein ACRQ5B_06910 [Pseudarthrobacter sp. L19]|uniref:hypothetical protein n=1 Tax=Pseudarthrobacter sp. L19 TaxID=3423951 RepID=UPI003D7A8085
MQPTSKPESPALKARTFQCMGTVIGLTVPMAANDDGGSRAAAEEALGTAADAVERIFRELDGQFSLYRPDSEASRVARREVTPGKPRPASGTATPRPRTGGCSPRAPSPRNVPTEPRTCPGWSRATRSRRPGPPWHRWD